MHYRLAEGVRTEPLDHAWAAFSALSGETQLLNTEAAAVLELLANGPADEQEIARTLATDAETDLADVTAALRHIWDQLVAAGLVESVATSDAVAEGSRPPISPSR